MANTKKKASREDERSATEEREEFEKTPFILYSFSIILHWFNELSFVILVRMCVCAWMKNDIQNEYSDFFLKIGFSQICIIHISKTIEIYFKCDNPILWIRLTFIASHSIFVVLIPTQSNRNVTEISGEF